MHRRSFGPHVGFVAASLVSLLTPLASASIPPARHAPEYAERSSSPHPSVTRLIEAHVFSALSPDHQQMITNLATEDPATRVPRSACFAEGTSDATMHAFSAAVFGLNEAPFGGRYQTGGRWSNTTGGSTGSTGTPITLRYSFVPDGTNIPGGAGEADSPSDLFARLNPIYGGNTAQWQALYASVFERWGQLCGVTYIFEPNDDGAAFPGSPGAVGVRGDCRMAGHPIDGNSGILAFNYFPNTGDMVIDTADSFYSNTGTNSLRLRNVLSHEHGHGMGMAHVCPIAQTKLMEPFISTAYDGPRHDEVRHSQRLYGDINEPDNTSATAINVGTISPGAPQTFGSVPAPALPFGSTLSIDGDGESDYTRFTVAAPGGATVTVTPIGLSYDDSAQACSGQSGSCCSGNLTDSRASSNLAVQIIGVDGTTVLATADTAPAGQPEVASGVPIPTAGNFFIRVFETGSTAQSQLYTLTIAFDNQTFAIQIPGGPPALLAPGVPTTFDVLINAVGQTVVANSPTLFYRVQGEVTYTGVPLTSVSGNLYRATLPAFACNANPNFYLSAQASITGALTSPAGAPNGSNFYSAVVGSPSTLFADAFETNLGWTTSGTATSGLWTRADPIGTAAQPENDVSNPGTLCYFTGQGTPGGGLGENDVDAGTTILTSPTFDLAGSTAGTLAYSRWYDNTRGGAPAADTFVVEISSNNGSTWQNVETVGPGFDNTGGWIAREIAFSSLAGLARTNQMRVRFTAADLATGSLVEAAVDEFIVSGVLCTNPPTDCPADWDGDDDVDSDDIAAFFQGFESGEADFDADGDTDSDDVTGFFTAFEAGC